MKNEDYLIYIKSKPFHEKLRAFANAAESMIRCSYEASEARKNGNTEGCDYYTREYHGQSERAEWLYKDIVNEHDRLEDLLRNATTWAMEVSDQLTGDLIHAAGIVSEDLKHLGYEKNSFPDLYMFTEK